MKTCYVLLFLLASCLLLTGCATPLTMEKDGLTLAHIVGVDHYEVKFISYCNFAEAKRGERWSSYLRAGIVVLTEKHLVILIGDFSNDSTKEEIRLLLSDVNGVDLRKFGLGRQIQLLKGEDVIVLEIKAYNVWIDRAGSEELFNLILAAGVPKWESEKWFTSRPIPVPLFIPIH